MEPRERTWASILRGVAPEWGVFIAAFSVAGILGFRFPFGHGWLDGALNILGVILAAVGYGLACLPEEQASSLPWPPGWALRICALGAGCLLILGFPAASALLVFLLAAGLYTRLRGTRGAGTNPPRSASAYRERLRHTGPAMCGVAAGVLLLEMYKDTQEVGGLRAHALELGVYGVALALLGLAWAVGMEPAAEASGRAGMAKDSAGRALRPMAAGIALCAAASAALLIAIRVPVVNTLDADLGNAFFRSGDLTLSEFLERISASGGRDLVVIWLPLILLLLVALRRSRSIRFLLCCLLGGLGLQTILKTAVGRARPEFVKGVHLDSFPSGHTLTATVLAGALLVIGLPLCRSVRSRALLCAAAITWPLLMGISRVYLGRHYPLDTLASLVLGIGWVLLAHGLYLAMTHSRFGRLQVVEADADGSPTAPGHAALKPASARRV